MSSVDYIRRLVGTGLSFSIFGLGALFISATFFPVIHLTAFSRERAHRRCQRVVHHSFQVFIWMMEAMGVLTYEITGKDKLRHGNGNLLLANHPTLLDVVFIISMVPTAKCVVKKAAWRNPFMASVLWATGYIQSDDPDTLIHDCIDSMTQDNNLVIFPEATRTVPGRPMRLKRGAAAVIATSRSPFIPVFITCEPSTLSKGKKWYEIPSRRVHFKITVGNKIDPGPFLVEGQRLSQNSRRVNNEIRQLLIRGVERNEQPG